MPGLNDDISVPVFKGLLLCVQRAYPGCCSDQHFPGIAMSLWWYNGHCNCFCMRLLLRLLLYFMLHLVIIRKPLQVAHVACTLNFLFVCFWPDFVQKEGLCSRRMGIPRH